MASNATSPVTLVLVHFMANQPTPPHAPPPELAGLMSTAYEQYWFPLIFGRLLNPYETCTIKPHLFTSHNHCWHLTRSNCTITVPRFWWNWSDQTAPRDAPLKTRWLNQGSGKFPSKMTYQFRLWIIVSICPKWHVFSYGSGINSFINLIGKDIPKNSVFNKRISWFFLMSLSAGKPIHGSCAIYFPVGIFSMLGTLLRHKYMCDRVDRLPLFFYGRW